MALRLWMAQEGKNTSDRTAQKEGTHQWRASSGGSGTDLPSSSASSFKIWQGIYERVKGKEIPMNEG